MPLLVHFQSTRQFFGRPQETFIAGRIRKRESIATGGTGSETANADEVAVLYNSDGAGITVAHGSTPDASATTGTKATSAAYTIPPATLVPVYVREGDKFAVAS